MSLNMNSAAVPTLKEDLFGDEQWISVHKRFVADTQEKEPEVVFIGDSIIAYLQYNEIWDTHFSPMHALNFGVGGERTENVLWRCLNGEMDNISPKAIILHVGTNNNGCSSVEIAGGIEAIVDVLRAKQAQAEIVVLALLPRGEKPNPLRERNKEVNEILKVSLSKKPKTQLVDIDKGFVQANGLISHHDMWDYLHLSKSGYMKSFEIVHEVLLQILLDDENEVADD